MKNWLTIIAEQIGSGPRSDDFSLLNPQLKIGDKIQKANLLKSSADTTGQSDSKKIIVSIMWADTKETWYKKTFVSDNDANQKYDELKKRLGAWQDKSKNTHEDINDPKKRFNEKEAIEYATVEMNRLVGESEDIASETKSPTSMGSYHGLDVEIMNQNKFSIAFKYTGKFYTAPAESIILKTRRPNANNSEDVV